MDIDTKFKIFPIVAILCLGCLLVSCHTSNNAQFRSANKGVIIFKEVLRVNVDHNHQKLQSVRLIKLTNTSTKIPILMRPKPRFGVFHVYKQVRPEDIVQYIGPRQDYIYIPISEEIVSYVFLLRELDSSSVTTPWHLFEIPNNQFEFKKNPNISLPLVSSLPLLSGSIDETYYLSLIAAGEERYKKLSEEEK